MEDLIIIGGGPAGMTAAITAKLQNPRLKVHILERKERVGKKLLSTGNGRCNITNSHVTEKNYHGLQPEFVLAALQAFPPAETIRWFHRLGLLCKEEKEGKIYPYCGQASAVLDCLRYQLDHLNIPVTTNIHINKIKTQGGYFTALSTHEPQYTCKNLIIAAGGCASPQLGSDGSGFQLLEGLKHPLTNHIAPVLVQLKSSSPLPKALQGIKFQGIATLYHNGRKLAQQEGEILFTPYGLSGPPILQLSTWFPYYENLTIGLDFMPDYTLENLQALLQNRAEILCHRNMEEFFTGFVHKKIGMAVGKYVGIEKLSLPVSHLNLKTLQKIAHTLKNLSIPITGTQGFNNAQATAGGALTRYFSPATMESTLMPGLYAVGEVLDIFGDCGGYNLQWSWASGYLAGLHNGLKTKGETNA